MTNIEHDLKNAMQEAMTSIKSFKQVFAEATSKVTQFPAAVFPILLEDDEYRAKRIPVLSWQSIEEIEHQANFKAWAADPRTGAVNLKIDQADLNQAVKEWLASMGPTRPH